MIYFDMQNTYLIHIYFHLRSERLLYSHKGSDPNTHLEPSTATGPYWKAEPVHYRACQYIAQRYEKSCVNEVVFIV